MEQETKGMVFYHDGSLLYDKHKIKVRFRNQENTTLETETKEHGSFKISFSTPLFVSIDKVWIDDELIPKERIFQTTENTLMIVMKKTFFGSSKEGGLITGKVVDHFQKPLANIKIRGELEKSFFSFASDSETKSGGGGRFAIVCFKSMSFKKIYLDNKEPEKIEIWEDKKLKQVKADKLKVGTFNAVLHMPRPFLGLRWK